LAEGLPREAVLELAEARVDHYMRLCHHCAQTSLLALHEVFGLGDASFVKPLTPLPGIAERGESCGAVTGCLLALGLMFGRERLDDWAGWRACLVPARAFCDEGRGAMDVVDFLNAAQGKVAFVQSRELVEPAQP